jgi:photosystem II stability/assembly factor-like uncharacterized protein
MRGSTLVRGGRITTVLAALVVAGCDKDLTAVTSPALVARMVSDSVITRQGSIRVLFNNPINHTTALDPSNFTVTNTCTGLPVAGSLRFGGDTVIFSPSQALPFLTGLSVRVQGILDVNNQALPQPAVFRLRTENPPVSDISWQQLASPTNDFVSGVSFVDTQLGWINTKTGGVYRTDNGGVSFAAFFKSADITSTFDIRAASKDTLYMVGAPSFGGSTISATGLFRSVDGGRTFQVVFSDDPGNMSSLSLRKRTGAAPEMVMGGSRGSFATWRYDQQKDSIARFGPVGGSVFGIMAALSPNGANAAAVGAQINGPSNFQGVAYRSTDGGRSYTPVTLPAGTHVLRGVGFINNTDAFLLGDTSTVLRLNVATGVVTALGVANGIPQTQVDISTGTSIFFFFTRAAVAPDDPNVGWIIGTTVRRVPGQPDVRRGIILITRNGGTTFTRQAVQGAPENGLGFPELQDIFVMNKSFAVVGGDAGFIAARKSDVQNFAALCSFPAGQ